MWEFINGISQFDSRDYKEQAAKCTLCDLNDKLKLLSEAGALFHGVELSVKEYPYSNELLALAQECLIREPDHRPSPSELQRRAEQGYLSWKGKSSQPVSEILNFKTLRQAPLGMQPPVEWDIINQTAIDNMIKVYPTADGSGEPWFIFLRDLPLSMSVRMVKALLEKQLIGKPYYPTRGGGFEYIIRKDDQDLWLRGRALADDDTIGGIRLNDMETLLCYRKGAKGT